MKTYINFSRFFSHVQETPWYHEFLTPVVQKVGHQAKVLDVGTGAGKLLRMLIEDKEAICTGIDIKESMLAEARIKLNGLPVTLLQVKPGVALPLAQGSFDVVCICNVLFNMEPTQRDKLLRQCLGVLQRDGKVIVLTPTGKGSIGRFSSTFFKRNNSSFGLWFTMTRARARAWNADSYMEEFCKRHQLLYWQQEVFNGFGLLEIIERQ